MQTSLTFPRNAFQRIRPLGLLGSIALAVAVLLVVPLLAVVVQALRPGLGTIAHLSVTVLPEYVRNTLLLCAGVAVGVAVLGVIPAWLVTSYRFPGRRAFEWLLVLPLAVPAYVIAYAYTDFLQFAGPLQSMLRELPWWKAGGYRLPEVRSVGGAVLMFSLVLYPYVYLLARAAFIEQSRNLLEAGRLLGLDARGTFLRIAIPLARPAIAAGIALALMETLADFGTVAYFGVQTFTTGIFRAWLSMGDAAAASQLAAGLLAVVIALIAFERWNRGAARYDQGIARSSDRLQPQGGLRAWGMTLVCALPPLFGFLLPALILLRLIVTEPEPLFDARFLGFTMNSVSLAAMTSVAAVAIALLLAYAARLTRSGIVGGANRGVALGYAVPGAVIAVGILIPVTRLDNWIAGLLEAQFNIKVGLLITGSAAALIYAYLVRFLSVALQTVEAGLAKVKPSMEDAARSLGLSPRQVLARVHAPMLAGSLFTAMLIVFVDVMKELPATFALRPFNFDTLAVQAYHFASDERLPQAAAASLVIVGVGLIPVILLSRAIAGKRTG